MIVNQQLQKQSDEDARDSSAGIYSLIDNYAIGNSVKAQRANSRGVYNIGVSQIN